MTESIGTRLREAREKRQLSLQQASETTKVRAHYLQALENDDLSAMPSAAQARGFLRIYAEFLGLEISDLVPSAPVAPAVPASGTVSRQPAPAGGSQTSVPAARPSLLGNVRDLVTRRLRRGEEPAADESGSNGSIPGAAAEIQPESAKKKAA